MDRALLVIFGAVLAGCAGGKQLRIAIRPTADMNDARSCYVLARTVDDKLYGIETYDDVVAKAMSPDGTVLQAVVVVPGMSQEIRVPVPEKGRIAVYALFKQPEDDSWRLILPATVPEGVELRLGRARMCWTSKEAPSGTAGVCAAGQVRVRR